MKITLSLETIVNHYINQHDPEKHDMHNNYYPYSGQSHKTRHFGPAPSGRVTRRHNMKKRVHLTRGNLVLELPVPPNLVLPRIGEPEMMQTRYTAGFSLRQVEMHRTTELLLFITMYNEDEILFCRTMYGVMKNIQHLCTRKNSQTWEPMLGKRCLFTVVVCIVADGRKKIHPRVLDCLTLLGRLLLIYSNTLHRFGLDPNLHFKYPDKGIVPTQIIFCMKEKNQKKINSHRWFFNAFAAVLQPNVCVLLDVGTRPSNKSIYRLWKTFDLNSNVAGACGEISTYKGKNWSLLLNPLVAAQNFEYKISYTSHWQNNERGIGPLASLTSKARFSMGVILIFFTSNMYLAEDRILCFELVAKANSNWILKYVKGAVGETDVPESLPEFISQRRRWKSVLLFETVYNIIGIIFAWFSIVVLTSSLEDPSFDMTWIGVVNPIIQYILAFMIAACFPFFYGSKLKYTVMMILLALAMMYMSFAAIKCAVKAAQQGGSANSVMLYSVIITYGCDILAFDPWQYAHQFPAYMLLSPTYINILNIYAFSNLDDISWGTKQDTLEIDLGAVNTIQSQKSQVDVEVLSTAADVNEIYQEAIENLKRRQPGWQELDKKIDEKGPGKGGRKAKGTTMKGGNGKAVKGKELSPAEKEQAAKDYYANVRTNVLLCWVISNCLLIIAILQGSSLSGTFGDSNSTGRVKGYLVFILVFTTISNLVRFIGSTFYLLIRLITG
ncbi:chitin synthase-domain-containing protein [Rhodocollybia butyracea]|uniref:Chitin synthase n=1 Tax=Rhodocollybia butyracea TaxID=206335 RepID=A0A9P5PVJ5_9AGAR|nr:chitin synthase-domain-containing protein [Rhodocollybia butyracea]